MAEDKKQPKRGVVKKRDSESNHADDPKVYLEKIFELYKLWKSLPPMLLSYKFRNKVMSGPAVAERFGIVDETLCELLSIRSQKEFAEHFKIGINTPTDWNSKITVTDMLAESRKWAMQLTNNVVMKMYENALQKGGMSFRDREMFFKVVNQWNKKLALEHNAGDSLADMIKATLRNNKKDDVSKSGDK